MIRQNRKYQLFILLTIICLIGTMTIAYAILSTTLTINGTAEVLSSSWDIHFDNIQINSGSITASSAPKIIDSQTINFIADLKTPGDYYKFTVDIVNAGNIDAMIDSVVKTPTLTETQAKYLRYEIEYTDGNSINSKQLLKKDTKKTLSILVAYRSDISTTVLPTEEENLNLSFTVVYTQADSTGIEVSENTPIVRMVNGNINTIGSEVAIGNEHFYVFSSDNTSVKMLAKYNLYVGNECNTSTPNSCIAYGEEATGLQDSTMKGYGTTPRKGTIGYSSSYQKGTNYSDYIGSKAQLHVINYKTYLENLGIEIQEARLITKDELELLGCSSTDGVCSNAPSWVYSTSYWTATAYDEISIWRISSSSTFLTREYTLNSSLGVRPVIKISKIYF